MQMIDLTFEEANEPTKEATNNTQKQHNEDWMSEGIKLMIQTRKEISEKILNSKLGRITKAIELLKGGFWIDETAEMLGLGTKGVHELLYNLMPKHIKGSGVNTQLYDKNNQYRDELKWRIRESDKYPNLKYFLADNNWEIVSNSSIGDGICKYMNFDITIPCMSTIIIQTKSENDKEVWLKKIDNQNTFLSFLNGINCRRFFFTHEGIDTILSTLETDAEHYIEEGNDYTLKDHAYR